MTALSEFFYNYLSLKLTIRQSANDVIKKVIRIKHTITMLERLHCEWMKIYENLFQKL